MEPTQLSYKQRLQILDDQTSSELLSCGVPDHRSLAFLQFLKTAKSKINMATSGLWNYSSNDILLALEQCLKRGVTINVIIESGPDKIAECGFLKVCKTYKNCSVKLYPKVLKAYAFTKDDTGFRYFEPSISGLGGVGVVGFNNKKVVSRFQSTLFGTFFDSLEIYRPDRCHS